jgi:hypothetical protein
MACGCGLRRRCDSRSVPQKPFSQQSDESGMDPYSGPICLAIYWFSGRGQIRRDALWRKSFRSTATTEPAQVLKAPDMEALQFSRV